jgi:hypothetical protein
MRQMTVTDPMEKASPMELHLILVLFGAVALTLLVPAIRGMFR